MSRLQVVPAKCLPGEIYIRRTVQSLGFDQEPGQRALRRHVQRRRAQRLPAGAVSVSPGAGIQPMAVAE